MHVRARRTRRPRDQRSAGRDASAGDDERGRRQKDDTRPSDARNIAVVVASLTSEHAVLRITGAKPGKAPRFRDPSPRHAGRRRRSSVAVQAELTNPTPPGEHSDARGRSDRGTRTIRRTRRSPRTTVSNNADLGVFDGIQRHLSRRRARSAACSNGLTSNGADERAGVRALGCRQPGAARSGSIRSSTAPTATRCWSRWMRFLAQQDSYVRRRRRARGRKGPHGDARHRHGRRHRSRTSCGWR